MSDTIASPNRGRGILATVIAGVVVGVGMLVKATGGEAKPAEYSSPATMSAPPPAHGSPVVAIPAGPWATTVQLEELRSELRGYRGDVGKVLEELKAAQKQLRDIELEQAEERGEKRARAAGFRR